MENKKKKKKESAPSSLMHYTDIDALSYILNPGVKDAIGIRYMDFRFSHPSQCNDPMEQNFYKNALYTGSEISELLKASVKANEEKTGQPFIFSMIHHKRSVMRQCPLTEIPMWNMYANKSDKVGVRLRLDYKELTSFCKDKNIDIFPCAYLNKEEMRQVTENIRKNQLNLRVNDYARIYKQEIKFKPIEWNYENEYRMVIWTNDFETVDDKRYVYVKIPLHILKTIQISPFAEYEENKEKIERVLNSIRMKNNEIKIEKSKILIR